MHQVWCDTAAAASRHPTSFRDTGQPHGCPFRGIRLKHTGFSAFPVVFWPFAWKPSILHIRAVAQDQAPRGKRALSQLRILPAANSIDYPGSV